MTPPHAGHRRSGWSGLPGSTLTERGVDVSAIQQFPWGDFVFFNDPDGNKWAVQAIPARS